VKDLDINLYSKWNEWNLSDKLAIILEVISLMKLGDCWQ